MCSHSSSIIQHLEQSYKTAPEIATAFFYFRFDDTQTQSVDEMLCALIKQICAQRPITPQPVQSLNEFKVKGHRPSRKALEDALIATVQGFDGVYVVLDALDECPLSNDKREELLKSLTRIHDQDSQNLHLLCTSRRETDIERVLKVILCSNSAFDIDLTVIREAIDHDIGLYINETFRTDETFKSWKDEWKDEAKCALIDKADGMYVYACELSTRLATLFSVFYQYLRPLLRNLLTLNLRFQYVALQFETLKRHENIKMIRRALRELPGGLDDTYNRILEVNHFLQLLPIP
jgi:hypothetical protein